LFHLLISPGAYKLISPLNFYDFEIVWLNDSFHVTIVYLVFFRRYVEFDYYGYLTYAGQEVNRAEKTKKNTPAAFYELRT